jgi:glycosyltransferase involved in cell wall biosynthesis
MLTERTIGDKTERRSTEPRATRVAMVFATDFQRASAGGIMTLLSELIRRLSERFRVLFVGVGDPDESEAVRRRVGAPSMVVLPVLSPERRPPWVPLNIVFTIALFRKRRAICHLADLVHVHRMETALPFVIRKSKPVLLTVHGSSKFHAMTQTGPLRWRAVKFLYDRIEGFVFSRVDRVILVSGEAHEYYCQRHPRLRRKFVVIPNFIETSEFQPIERAAARTAYHLTAEDTAIVYAGRLVQEKRVDLLIEAFALLLPERPSARLFIAGEGPDNDRLQQQVTRQHVAQVSFLGLLPKSEVHRLLAGADVLVLPSRFEGFPMVALEALAYGVPVVASDVGGIREILNDGLERFIWNTADPEELKRKILEAAGRRAQLRDLCIARANHFDTARILPRLEELYASVVSASA